MQEYIQAWFFLPGFIFTECFQTAIKQDWKEFFRFPQLPELFTVIYSLPRPSVPLAQVLPLFWSEAEPRRKLLDFWNCIKSFQESKTHCIICDHIRTCQYNVGIPINFKSSCKFHCHTMDSKVSFFLKAQQLPYSKPTITILKNTHRIIYNQKYKNIVRHLKTGSS